MLVLSRIRNFRSFYLRSEQPFCTRGIKKINALFVWKMFVPQGMRTKRTKLNSDGIYPLHGIIIINIIIILKLLLIKWYNHHTVPLSPSPPPLPLPLPLSSYLPEEVSSILSSNTLDPNSSLILFQSLNDPITLSPSVPTLSGL